MKVVNDILKQGRGVFRTLIFVWVYLCSTLVGFSDIMAKQKESGTPNIILIYADDLGRGMLSAWGQKYFSTPHIDRLVEEGMQFDNAYGCHFCAPARASLITGMHDAHAPNRFYTLTRPGIYVKEAGDIDLEEISKKIHAVAPPRPNQIYLATVAKNAGYKTAEFGKLEWGFATTPERIKSHGWDYHFGYYDHQRCHGFYPPFLFENGKLVEIEGNTHIDAAKSGGEETPENYKQRWDFTGKKQYSEYLILDKMLEFLDKNNPLKTNRPIFVYYSSQLPHGPIQVPEIDPEVRDNPNLTSYEKEYATMVKILDRSVGKIYAKCEELGILENTVFIFTADNGHEVYTVQEGRTWNSKSKPDGTKYDNITEKYYSTIGHDIFDGNNGMAGLKRDNWEGGVRVPLAWYWKGKIQAGAKSKQLVNNYDILNTIAELTGQQPVEGKDSHSYAQTLLTGHGKEKPYTVYSSKLGPAIVTREGWKLRYQMKDDIFQLYFLPNDYKEEHILNEKYPEKVKELQAILLKECDGDYANGGFPKFVKPE